MFERIKNWIIKKLGGWTEEQYRMLTDQYRTEAILCDDFSKKNNVLSVDNELLSKELQDCRDTLAGLEILKTKIETFRAETTVPKMLRSEKELKREIDAKTQKVLMSLYNDLVSQGRFIVVDMKDKGNKFEVSATVSVLEGGVINEETQLSQDTGGTGDSRESGETPQND